MAEKKSTKKPGAAKTQKKSQSVKTVKQGNKLRRTVMGTLSGVCMASALIVAAIPVQKAQAVSDTDLANFTLNYSVEPEADGRIPTYDDHNAVFFNSSGLFGAAYVNQDASMVGVLAYYNVDSPTAPQNLEVPDHINAFQYDFRNRLVAVTGDTGNGATPACMTGDLAGTYLCYVSQEQGYMEVRDKDGNGDDIKDPETGEYLTHLEPDPNQPEKLAVADAEHMADWIDKPLYKCTVAPKNPDKTTLDYGVDVITTLDPRDPAEQLSFDIRYIGSTKYNVGYVNENIVVEHDTADVNDLDRAGESGVFSEKAGVFQGARNFSTLKIPESILAIGENAFRECSMSAVTAGTSIHCIGNNAFRECRQLSSVSLANDTNLAEIGDFAFAGCSNLSSIKIPNQVRSIGSGCFMDDTALSAANLYGYVEQNGITDLSKLGDGAFYGCSSLGQIYLPRYLTNQDTMKYVFKDCVSLVDLGLSENAGSDNGGKFNYTNVSGCYNLKTVKVPSRLTKFDCEEGNLNATDGVSYCKNGECEKCVFGRMNLGYNTPFPFIPTAGADNSKTYSVNDEFTIISYRNSPAYRYACEHEYSVGYLDAGYEGQFERVKDNYFYTVNDQNQLINFGVYDPNQPMNIVELPSRVGSHYISSIGSDTFQGNDKIEYVYIPYTVTDIANDAFRNCKNLTEVEFEDAMGILTIGQNAFKTNATDDSISLRFTGEIDSESLPFVYAMTPGNNFNDSSLPTKYISYTSDFPYSLEVKLELERDEVTNEIIRSVPTLIGAPDYEDFENTGRISPASDEIKNEGFYSLSSYDERRENQNKIVRSAYEKYDRQRNGEDVQYSEDEEKVIAAVFRPVLPDGILSMNPDVYQDNDYITQVVMNSVEEVPDEAFKDCDNLSTVVMRSSGNPNGEKIGSQAFADCPKLSTVVLPASLSEMGSVPFFNSDYHDSENYKLENVDFSGNPQFEFANGIIYENIPGGKRIVECLPTRGYSDGTTGKVKAEEFDGVTTMDDQAFMNCTGVTQAVFGESPVSEIPDSCFENCTRLNYCEVSPYTTSIGEHAFRNTALSDIRIPASVAYIAESALTAEGAESPSEADGKIKGLNIQCEDPSTALTYANKFGYGTADRILHKWKVKFFDMDGNQIGEEQLVEDGSDAIPPEAPEVSGYTFVSWRPSYKGVGSDLFIYPNYRQKGNNSDISENTTDDDDKRPIYIVTFYNYDGSAKVSTQKVREGDPAVTPTTIPERDGYTFTGWLPEYSYIIEDTDVYPQYKKNSGTPDDPGKKDDNKKENEKKDDNNNNNNSDPNNNSNNNNSNNNSTDPNKNNSNTSNNTSNNSTTPSTITKPATTTTTKTTTTRASVSGNSAKKKNTDTGTKVQVNKAGISNPGLATATVNGSTDDFIVKISDSDEARSAVEQALLGEYGDLSDIRFFAMDISLYDKTGTTKIQNTQGLTVTVTMPIPDALQTYGGNNMAGAISSSNSLEKLETRFTTIEGQPCISFVARHFSPYTIYVDLNNLTATGYSDVTPKTGDPIHPKWFLSIGLGIMSILMFTLKGSKRKVVKVIS